MIRTTARTTRQALVYWIALSIGLCSLLLGLLAVPTTAYAAECAPDPTTACIQGIINTSTGEPAANIGVALSGGADSLTTVTDSAGRWAFSVSTAGTYTVTVDPQTLPEGQFLKSVASREVTVQLNNLSSALFPLSDTAGGAAESGAPGGTGSGESEAAAAPTTVSAAADFSWPRFWQQFMSGIRMGLLIALASLGLSLVFGTTGLSNFAQGEMVTLGGLLAAVFMGLLGNLWLAATAAVVASAGLGWAQDRVLWRPLRRRRLSLMQMMIVSIGLSITLQYLFQFFFGSSVIRIDTATPQTLTLFGVTLTVQSYLAMGISLLAIIAVGLGLKFTRFGRATRAISDNPALARASGINVDRVITIVWVVGGGLAGLSGVFFGLVFNGLTWFIGGSMLLMLFAAVTLGGLGTAFGAFVGSMIIGMMVELTNIWLPGDLKFATALLLLILILLVRPQGIFGRKERIG